MKAILVRNCSVCLHKQNCHSLFVLFLLHFQKLLSIATNGRDIPSWLEGVGMAPQYIQSSRGTPASDGDVIQLMFRCQRSEGDRVQRSLNQLRRWGTNFTQKYANFLDGIFTIQPKFNTETFERYAHSAVS